MSLAPPPRLWFERPADALRSAAGRWADHEFLSVLPETASKYGIEARAYSYAQSLTEVETRQAAYIAAGVRPGQRVGLLLENRPAFFFHWLALNGIGASAVPLNIDWRAAELEYVIGHSELVMAIVPQESRSNLVEAARNVGRSVAVLTEADIAAGDAKLPRIDAAASAEEAVATGRRECALLYTSGTTGLPKGCVLSNEYFVWAGQWYASVGGLCAVRHGAERMLTPLPTTHMNAMTYSAMCMLLTGGCLIAVDRFHPATWWASVREARATIVHYLGVMPALLLAAPESAQDRAHEVRFGFGAGVSPAHHGLFEQRFNFPLLEAWAMTETGAGAVIVANREPRLVGTACFGTAEPAVEYRIVGADGRAAGAGVAGELQVRAAGPNPRFGFFERYLKDDAATRAAWEDGWFRTGDIVQQNAAGQLHFVDRTKNMIRRSGENISALEVEGVLAQHPLVHAVGIAGVPDQLRGEEVLACIVPSRSLEPEQRQDAAAQIVRFALQRLSYFKAPGFVHFCEALPRTPTEKVQRAELKRMACDALGAARVVDARALKRRLS